MVKKAIGILLGIIIILAGAFITPPEGLSREGLLAIAILFLAIDLWATDVAPMGISALLIIVLIPILGILPATNTWVAFGSVSLFFVIATSAITTILLKTTIPLRTLDKLVRWSKNNPRKFVLGFMIVSAVFSSFMSNIPICMAMLGFALVMIKAMDVKPLESNFAKCLLIGVPGSVMVGGMMTPVGTTVNIVAMDILQKTTGTAISFLDWMIVGIPSAIVLFVFLYFSLILVFKPESIPQVAIEKIKDETAAIKKVSVYEIKVIVILLTMFVLWILNGVFPVLNTTYVAVCGLFAMFLPKINLLTFKEFSRDCPWNVALIVGGVSVITAAIMTTGAASFVADAFASATGGLGLVTLAFVFAVFFVAFNAIFPQGPGVVGLLAAPMVAIVVAGGVLSPVFIILALAIACGATFLLPISPIYLITMDHGYYTFGDVVKAGIIPSVGVIVTCVCVALPIVSALGL